MLMELLTLAILNSGMSTDKVSKHIIDVPSTDTNVELVATVQESWETTASWYGEEYHGYPTASGEVFNMYDLTAAENSLPFGTMVRVTNLDTGLSVVVRINDTGGFNGLGRGIDLSYEAAKQIGGVHSGVFPVLVEVLY